MGGDLAANPEDMLPIVTAYRAGGGALSILYRNPGFAVRVDYVLSGGSISTSGQSDIGETITITNTSADPLLFDLFQYSDFNLSYNLDTVSARTCAGCTMKQFQTSQPGLGLTETVLTPGEAR